MLYIIYILVVLPLCLQSALMGNVRAIHHDTLIGSVRAIMHDAQGRLWVATQHDGLRQAGSIRLYDEHRQHIGYLSPQGKVITTTDEVKFCGDICCLLNDSKGRIWMGSRWDGLFILVPQDADGMSYRVIQYEAGEQSGELMGNAISDIVEDSRGRIWIGCYDGGLNLVARPTDPDCLTFYNYHNGLYQYPMDAGQRVHDLCISSNDELLIGTDQGMISCSLQFNLSEELTFYHNDAGDRPHCLSGNAVMHISQLRDGRLLVGTLGGGLNVTAGASALSDSLSFTCYDSRRPGLADSIYATHQVDDGRLLILSADGLSFFDERLNLQEVCVQGMKCSAMLPLVLPSGDVYIATPDSLLQIRKAPKP